MSSAGSVTVDHLSRKAVLYVRQSTIRQVRENETSLEFQLALRKKIIEYGWPPERIEVIDCDLGVSGKYSENREGYQKLIADVAIGSVGVIASWDASRLSRNNSDWAKIIDFCTMTNTLVLDEDGIYDPTVPTDRLLLGVKGSISEMEWYSIRKRMSAGLVTKASSGELQLKLPVGYVFNPLGKIIKDPNKDVQVAVKKLFSTFNALGSAYKTVEYFREHNILFPGILRTGAQKGELVWKPLTIDKVLFTLKHPIYSGRYTFGRSRCVTTPLKRSVVKRNEDEWIADIHDNHEPYVSEDEQKRILQLLEQNSYQSKVAYGTTAPGNGCALLQGIVYCGCCGSKMATQYQASTSEKREGSRPYPLYVCDGYSELGSPLHKRCMTVNGFDIDRRVSTLIRERLSEAAVQHALEMKDEVIQRWNENEKVLKTQLERAQYESDLMRRRYMNCDPDNQLVRVELEKAYNDSLRNVMEAEKRLEQEILRHAEEKEAVMKERLATIVQDFNTVWDAPDTDVAIKKRLVRHLIQDVTLCREGNSHVCEVKIVFTGGETEVFTALCNFYGPGNIEVKGAVYEHLAANGILYTPSELAQQLNDLGGLEITDGHSWDVKRVSAFMKSYGLMTKKEYYQQKGYLTTVEVATAIGITHTSMLKRIQNGRYDGKYIWANEHLILMTPGVIQEP